MIFITRSGGLCIERRLNMVTLQVGLFGRLVLQANANERRRRVAKTAPELEICGEERTRRE